MYEVFEHTADLGLRIRAASREALFADAARGLCSLLVANLGDVQLVQERTYTIAGDDLSLLLFDWLNELLYTFESERLLLREFDVQFTATGLQATARGDTMSPQHEMEHEVKAITYHQLRVEHTDSGWLAEVIVDI